VRAAARKRSAPEAPASPIPFVEATWSLSPELLPGAGTLTTHDEAIDEPFDPKRAAFDVDVDDLRSP
jgi:hypothetical protein